MRILASRSFPQHTFVVSRRVLITGSIAYDLLLASDGSFADAIGKKSLEHLSVSFVTPHFRRHHGGTGANIAWNLALLRRSPFLVGTVGDDGGAYLELLRERGVRTEYVESLAGHATATAIIATDSGERQITFFHPGADSFGSWPDLSSERGEIALAIVSARSVPLMMRAVEWCLAEKVPLIFDPGQQVHGFSDDELKRSIAGSRGVVVNAYESSLLQGRLKLSEAALAAKLPFLIVTRGEAGFTLYEGGKDIAVPSCRADRVVNPTGAGDAFRSGLLAGLASGWSLLAAARLGASLGSFVVEQEGTLLDRLDMESVWARAGETYGEQLPALA